MKCASEIKSSRRKASEGSNIDPGVDIVTGTLHLALSLLIIPLRIHSRITRFNKSRHVLKQTVKNASSAQAYASQDRVDFCNASAKDPRWFVK